MKSNDNIKATVTHRDGFVTNCIIYNINFLLIIYM